MTNEKYYYNNYATLTSHARSMEHCFLCRPSHTTSGTDQGITESLHGKFIGQVEEPARRQTIHVVVSKTIIPFASKKVKHHISPPMNGLATTDVSTTTLLALLHAKYLVLRTVCLDLNYAHCFERWSSL